MVDYCANPECMKPLHYLRGGNPSTSSNSRPPAYRAPTNWSTTGYAGSVRPIIGWSGSQAKIFASSPSSLCDLYGGQPCRSRNRSSRPRARDPLSKTIAEVAKLENYSGLYRLLVAADGIEPSTYGL